MVTKDSVNNIGPFIVDYYPTQTRQPKRPKKAFFSVEPSVKKSHSLKNKHLERLFSADFF